MLAGEGNGRIPCPSAANTSAPASPPRHAADQGLLSLIEYKRGSRFSCLFVSKKTDNGWQFPDILLEHSTS